MQIFRTIRRSLSKRNSGLDFAEPIKDLGDTIWKSLLHKDSIKDLESQARNTKHLMDKLNRAAYGMTFDEAIRLGKENPPPCSEHDEGKD